MKKNDVVTTLEELEALPLFTIVELPSGQAALHNAPSEWKLFGTANRYKADSEAVWLPATVLRTPEAKSE